MYMHGSSPDSRLMHKMNRSAFVFTFYKWNYMILFNCASSDLNTNTCSGCVGSLGAVSASLRLCVLVVIWSLSRTKSIAPVRLLQIEINEPSPLHGTISHFISVRTLRNGSDSTFNFFLRFAHALEQTDKANDENENAIHHQTRSFGAQNFIFYRSNDLMRMLHGNVRCTFQWVSHVHSMYSWKTMYVWS